MTSIPLKYVHRFKDRHKVIRYYFRRPGYERKTLPGMPGSDEFQAAYQEALRNAPKPQRIQAGSVATAIAGYFASSAFTSLAAETRRTRRNILNGFSDAHGSRILAELTTEKLSELVGRKSATPSAARNLLGTLRAMMKYCVAVKLLASNPTIGVTSAPIKTSGYRTWSESDIDAFKTKHERGTRARMALALLLCTGQRRGDIVVMGRQHMRDGTVYVKQQKTGAELLIQVHPELQAEIDAMPAGQMTFLVTVYGKPFSPAGFTNWFRERCNDADLPIGMSAHGLRKATCRRLAEAGCSEKEIAAISGHATLSEVQRYTKAADQQRMGKRAMDAMIREYPSRTKTGNP